MSERFWATIGKVAALATIVGTIFVIIGFVSTLTAPSSRLVADIRPMAFQMPVSAGQLSELSKTNTPIDSALAHLIEVGRATSLVKINLYNNGELPIAGIHINVAHAMLYAKGSEGMYDSSVLPSDLSGTTVDNLLQGGHATI
jgi:hypothetical protein